MAPLWHDGFTDKFERERESLLKVYKVSAFGFNERLKGEKRMERDGGGGEVLHIAIWPSKNNGRQICRCRFLRQSNESHKRWWAWNKRNAYGKRRMYRFRHSKVEKITKRCNNYSWLFRRGEERRYGRRAGRNRIERNSTSSLLLFPSPITGHDRRRPKLAAGSGLRPLELRLLDETIEDGWNQK
jgi:hypothetical protein